MRQWVIKETKDGFDGMEFQDSAEVPQPGDYEVLVKIQAVSINYRDLIIPQVLVHNLHVDPR
jgi:NADPH:quinone reductase-like Zn-dependent oxidoreductase